MVWYNIILCRLFIGLNLCLQRYTNTFTFYLKLFFTLNTHKLFEYKYNEGQ